MGLVYLCCKDEATSRKDGVSGKKISEKYIRIRQGCVSVQDAHRKFLESNPYLSLNDRKLLEGDLRQLCVCDHFDSNHRDLLHTQVWKNWVAAFARNLWRKGTLTRSLQKELLQTVSVYWRAVVIRHATIVHAKRNLPIVVFRLSNHLFSSSRFESDTEGFAQKAVCSRSICKRLPHHTIVSSAHKNLWWLSPLLPERLRFSVSRSKLNCISVMVSERQASVS